MQLNADFKHQNLPDRVADYIAASVARGDLGPGERIYEKEICEALGVSRVPVREAVRLLQAQGLVRSEPNRGTYVSNLGVPETLEMLDIRITFERIAVMRLRNDRAGLPEHLRLLETHLTRLERAAAANDLLDYCYEDLAFHRTLVTRAGSTMVLSLWESLSRFMLVFLMNERMPSAALTNSVADHRRLINAIAEASDEEATEEVARHIKQYVDERIAAAGMTGLADVG